MRVVFYSYGTRGDAQPQVVLASQLRDRGHQVRVAAPENLRGFVESSGLEYAPLHGNSQAIMESEEGRRWLSSGDVIAFMKALGKILGEINPEVFRTAAAAAEGADAIVGGTLSEDLAYTLAQKRDVPFLLAHTIPYERTGAWPSPLVTTARIPLAFVNRLTYSLFRKLAWDVNRGTLNPYRQSLGLAPLATTVVAGAHEHGAPVLQLWSEQVLPRPADAAPNITSTGYIRMPPALRERMGEATAPGGLVDWLERGPAPVYVGFGSMPVLDPLAMAKEVIAVAEALDLRVVLSAGWTNLGEVEALSGERVYLVRGVDHSWLLPRCVAAVHHGGAGTTAASLEAGVPTVVCSVFADQPFWGERVSRLGVGAHVPFPRLDRRTLTAALRACLQDDVRQRAADLGAKLRAEDGATVTVDAIEASILGRGRVAS
ncbi:MAG: glycosyltransferase [Pseudomonadota bacterium]|nr:glycosyltransferase [Pseudomonadota bacterium]